MIPLILRDFNTFFEGGSWLGNANEIELPKLARKTEELYMGNGPINLDMGNEALEAIVTLDGSTRDAFTSYGICDVSGLALRFAGAHERQDQTCETQSIETIMRGRISEIDNGTAKKGDKHQYKLKFSLSYYKLIIDNSDVIEIDHVNYKEVVGGNDRLAKLRAAIGV